MRTWEEIKQEVKEYKENRMDLVEDYKEGHCVECIHDGKTYYGRVHYASFDNEVGKAYVYIKLNKNEEFSWSSSRDNKRRFFDDELEQIKLIENTFDTTRFNELNNRLEEIDDEPMTRQEREKLDYKLKCELLNLRKDTCIHNWSELTMGSWLSGDVVGYECLECGLRLDKEQKINYDEMF